MLFRLVEGAIRLRLVMVALLALLLAGGVWAMVRLPVDAMPDVATVQVSVMTKAAGLSPIEVERVLTLPIENSLNGIPGATELRSVSRAGLSAVTVVFKDGTDIWFARQLVLERLRVVQGDLPPGTETPELSPVSTGLGEIFQFVVRSDHHSAMQLRTLLDWEILPKLRQVPGVVEVNTMGGELKQYQVVVDRSKLKLYHLTLTEVVARLQAANLNAGGGYLERGAEAFVVRGEGMLRDEADINGVVLRTGESGPPVLVKDVASVKIGQALPYGVVTYNGEGEAVTGIVLMLSGENSRTVVNAVSKRVKELRHELPPGVRLEVSYDRSDFVGRTLSTVVKNLLEGVLVVTVVLALFLGTFRGAAAVVLGIPASMSVALFGMHLFGVTGDLMSLGAIDFGFLVDGPIVMLEAVMGLTAGKKLIGLARAEEYSRIVGQVVKPVAFAVAIIMLVYLPLLTLEGIEGKMFRPMAITMACALFGALLYSLLFFPAVLVLLVGPPKGHGPAWLDRISHGYERAVATILALRWHLIGASLVLFFLSAWAFSRAGADFVPRIFEGDAMVTIRRAPSISLSEAKRLDLETERILLRFPEVVSTLGMTGRAEVATDPVGSDNTDMLVRLKPQKEWTSARDFDELSEAFKAKIEGAVPGTFVSVSQPIEDKTNEMISGSRADVSIKVNGVNLEELVRLSDRIGEVVRKIPGSGDVRVERILGQPVISARADRARMARHGVTVADAFAVLSAAREGIRGGDVFEEYRRFELRVLQPPAEARASALGDLFVETQSGKSVPLREVVTLTEGDGPSAIRRQDRERTVRIDVNLRGRDLVSWVDEAKAKVGAEVHLKSGYTVTWGGQFENFERAQARLAVVVPGALALIFAMLFWMFRELRATLAVYLTLPFALTGGILGLLLRGLSFSLPAAVGFIALAGIAVLNGVVMASEVLRRLDLGEPFESAICQGSAHTVRAVLTTAAVAALGFLPMATASSAGAEVQRPLATVVIFGIAFGSVVTLMVLPGLLRILLQPPPVPQPPNQGLDSVEGRA
jgi:cobalt-zinc-cadmium resistance protein CzcA